MVRSEFNHYLRPSVLRYPRYDRPVRKTIRHRHFRRRQIRLRAYLRLLPRRFYWP
jgi:hypothetical protein